MDSSQIQQAQIAQPAGQFDRQLFQNHLVTTSEDMHRVTYSSEKIRKAFDKCEMSQWVRWETFMEALTDA